MFCAKPFTYLEIFPEDCASCCCTGWMKPEALYQGPVEEAWHSDLFVNIRKGLNQGVGKYCLGNCPAWEAANRIEGSQNPKPPLSTLRFSFDDTCNLRCKSCRDELKVTDQEIVRDRLQKLQERFGPEVKRLELCGAGDPIASPTYRKFLQTLSKKQWPRLISIMLHTNAQLLTEEMWNSFSSDAQKLIGSAIVSIDAATKETYEKIRRGGSWEKLQANLDFLATKVRWFEFAFVIQRDNYREIEDFFNFAEEFYKKHHVFVNVDLQNLMWWDWFVSEESYNSIRVDNDSEACKVVADQIREVQRKSYKSGVGFVHNFPMPARDLKVLRGRKSLI